MNDKTRDNSKAYPDDTPSSRGNDESVEPHSDKPSNTTPEVEPGNIDEKE